MIKLSLEKLLHSSFYPDLNINKLRIDDFLKPSISSKRHCQSKNITINGITCNWMIPHQLTSPKILLYFHGGGFVCGPSLLHWRMVSQLSKDIGCKSLIVNYRRIPEYPYPAAIEDMENVYNELLSETEPENIIFIGDSAGGGLALSLTMKLRNKKKPLPSKMILLSPWLDVSMKNPQIPELEELDHILAIPGLEKAGILYAREVPQENPYISPVFGDLSGLPPALLLIGTHDLFLFDCRKLKEKAVKSNFILNYQEWEEMFHIWMLNVPYLPEAREAVKEISKYIGID